MGFGPAGEIARKEAMEKRGSQLVGGPCRLKQGLGAFMLMATGSGRFQVASHRIRAVPSTK